MDDDKKSSPLQTLFDIAFNIAIPIIILFQLSGEDYLGPLYGLLVALAFPVGYSVWEFLRHHKLHPLALVGTVSVLLTGGISLLALDPQYLAIKEAAIPGVLGIATLISIKTRYPLIRLVVYNERIMCVNKVEPALKMNGTADQFAGCLKSATLMIALSFLLSSVLNYILTRWIVTSTPGSETYNIELGKMMALSFPVIALPCTIIVIASLFYIVRTIRKLTALEYNEIFRI